MTSRLRDSLLLMTWMVVTLAGGVAVAHASLDRMRAAFEAEAQGVLRALSQQARQNEAVPDLLGLLQPRAAAGQPSAEQRLPAVHPVVHRVVRRDASAAWPAELREAFEPAEQRSAQTARVALAGLDLAAGQYWLVRHADPASFALLFDLRPMGGDGLDGPFAALGDVRAWLELAGQRRVLVSGAAGEEAGGWSFGFRQRLQAETLPVDFVAVRRVGWWALPWPVLAGWCMFTSMIALGLGAWWHRSGATRLEAPRGGLLVRTPAAVRRRLGGMPRTAGLTFLPEDPPAPRPAPLRVTLRELDTEPPELAVARGAIRQAARQSRRTTQAIAEMQTLARQPIAHTRLQPVALDDLVRDALEWLEAECARHGVVATLSSHDEARWVMADPVALEHLVHQLIAQALQAVREVPPGERHIDVTLRLHQRCAVLEVRDSGPTPADPDPDRTFDARLARADGPAGLDATPCRAWVQAMGGCIVAAPVQPRGAVLGLSLPLAG